MSGDDVDDVDDLLAGVEWVAWWASLDDEQREYIGELADQWRADRASG